MKELMLLIFKNIDALTEAHIDFWDPFMKMCNLIAPFPWVNNAFIKNSEFIVGITKEQIHT